MANNDLFSSDNKIEDQVDDVEDLDLDDDKLDEYLEQMIGEQGKFYDPDREKAIKKLAKGKVHSDQMIENLKERMDKIREDYNRLYDESSTRARLQEVLEQLTKAQNNTASSDGTTPDTKKQDDKSALDLNQLDELISNKLSQVEETRRKASNLEMVKDKLREKFGTNYQKALREQANRLGVGEDFMNSLASSNPQAFLKIAGLEDNHPGHDLFQAAPRSQVNSQATGNKRKERTEAYYEEMRQKDSKKFHSVANWQQMMKDVERLGEDFYDL